MILLFTHKIQHFKWNGEFGKHKWGNREGKREIWKGKAEIWENGEESREKNAGKAVIQILLSEALQEA